MTDVTMAVDTATWFQLFDNRPNALALTELINNIPGGKIVVMGVSDDGQHRLISELRTAIKTLGSEVIDQLQFRGSWAIIGRKGASPGDPDIIEEVKGPYDGSVYLEKEYIVPNQTGYLTTERLGPVSSWDTLYVNHEIPNGASIDVIPIGIRKSQQEDTLSTFSLSSQYTSLDFINPNTYPYSKLRFKFTQNAQAESPTISEIGVSHRNAPELAINYQVANIAKDTVMHGEQQNLSFRVSNVGEGRAFNFHNKVDLYKDNIFQKTLLDSIIAYVNPDTFEVINLSYTLLAEDGKGNFKFLIELDAGNKVVELYEDNNKFELPFIVVEDTVTSVASALVSASFDGYEIYDGDYVSPDPQIDVFLDYQGSFNITDTNSVRVLLNQKQISQSQLRYKE
ncbi:MAG: interleukin-like EMT inducer domain-containing protein [Melioribacteraceae bacterium]|nr:interleukin-like EMT inducer domain-containing protein [Melioribacteraceae bacterium]